MARPTRRTIASGIAAWDADVDQNFSILTDGPFPIAQYATTGDLPAASSYADCLAIVGTGATAQLYISNGTTWIVYDGNKEASHVADSTATTAAQNATDFNTLLAALQAAGIMATS